MNQLFDVYTSSTTFLLDKLLPHYKVQSRSRSLTDWFDSDCHKSRRWARCAEWRFHRTRDRHCLAWLSLPCAHHRLYHQRETSYREDLVSRNTKDHYKGNNHQPLPICGSCVVGLRQCLRQGSNTNDFLTGYTNHGFLTEPDTDTERQMMAADCKLPRVSTISNGPKTFPLKCIKTFVSLEKWRIYNLCPLAHNCTLPLKDDDNFIPRVLFRL